MGFHARFRRLRPQSNSTMQAGTANVCILPICGVGALQADRLGLSRPQLQVQCRCQVRRHLTQQDKQFSQSGTSPCIIAESITIGTTAQMKLIEFSSSSLRSPFAQVFEKTPTCGIFIKVNSSCRCPQHSPVEGSSLHPGIVLPRAKIGTSSAAGWL